MMNDEWLDTNNQLPVNLLNTCQLSTTNYPLLISHSSFLIPCN